MDRGDDGIEMLLEIKEFSDQGRVQYIPGNHDIFTYNYVMCKDRDPNIYDIAKRSLEINKGKVTIEKLENFGQVVQEELALKHISKPITLQELITWLGEQPIQTVVHENQKNYALAHAMFDTKLYNMDRNFNLEKALNMQRSIR